MKRFRTNYLDEVPIMTFDEHLAKIDEEFKQFDINLRRCKLPNPTEYEIKYAEQVFQLKTMYEYDEITMDEANEKLDKLFKSFISKCPPERFRVVFSPYILSVFYLGDEDEETKTELYNNLIKRYGNDAKKFLDSNENDN